MPPREPPPPPPAARCAGGSGNARWPARPWRSPRAGAPAGLPRSAPPDVPTLDPGIPRAPPGGISPELAAGESTGGVAHSRDGGAPAGVTPSSHREPVRGGLILPESYGDVGGGTVRSSPAPVAARGRTGRSGTRRGSGAGARPRGVTR